MILTALTQLIASIAILGAFIALAVALRSGDLTTHEGATGTWSPAADLGVVAEAAADAPADLDLRRDYSPHHVRLHLASEHAHVGALGLSDEDAEAVHRYDHTNPETAGHHSIDQLNWTIAGAQRSGLDVEPYRRSLAPAWHELVKQINGTREVPVVPGRHKPKHAAREDAEAVA